jgi:hypothetical protein
MSVKPFDKLTLAGKRCRIARDVLKQLDAKRLVAEHRVYLAVKEDVEAGLFADPRWRGSCTEGHIVASEKAAQNIVLSSVKQCKVCALGSLLMAKVNFKNGVTLAGFAEQHGERGGIIEQLSGYFSAEQLTLIECVFEGKDYSFRMPADLEDKCVEHRRMTGLGYEDAEVVLRDIMHNIIRHNGEFRLTNKRTPAPTVRNQYSVKNA